MSLFSFFTDPVLRGPTLGSMFMAVAVSIVGVIALIRRRSLLGESLSHATYPGVVVAMLLGSVVFALDERWRAPLVLIGAFGSALIGLGVIQRLESRCRMSQDAALCLVLALSFGVGLTLASHLQFSHPVAYRQMEGYLCGQAANMTDLHIGLYGGLAVLVIGVVVALYKEIQLSAFDSTYAATVGLNLRLVDGLIFLMMVVAVVMGIRCVGVVLMSAMLIAPAVAARQFTHRLPLIFLLAGVFGAFSGWFGNLLSVGIAQLLYSGVGRMPSVPTGPTIVLVASLFALASFLFAPQRGLVIRGWRIATFRLRCVQENLLKAAWRQGVPITLDELAKGQSLSRWTLRLRVRRLCSHGWLEKTPEGSYLLTNDGQRRAAHIVRLHRLWEVYLVERLGMGAERVHGSAEEMEHILTPELERDLVELLGHPLKDPHHQPIPPARVT